MRSTVAVRILRLASLVLVGLIFVVMHYSGTREVGESTELVNGRVAVSAGSSPAVLLWSAAAIALFILLMVRRPGSIVEGAPTILRRVLAFVIDCVFSLCAVSSISALLPLWLEAARTGHFAWYFQRNYAVSTDRLAAISLPLTVALMILYFTFPLTQGRQSVGCFVTGIRVMPPFGNDGSFTFRAAAVRTVYALIGLFLLMTLDWDRDEQGRTWYDRKTGCTVVLVSDR